MIMFLFTVSWLFELTMMNSVMFLYALAAFKASPEKFLAPWNFLKLKINKQEEINLAIKVEESESSTYDHIKGCLPLPNKQTQSNKRVRKTTFSFTIF